MLKIAFIGKFNQTNTIICEAINELHASAVTYYDPSDIFSKFDYLNKADIGLVIVDLNTSHGFGNAPENITRLKQNISEKPLLILHPYGNNKFIEPLIEAGANGIISTTPTEEELTKAIEYLLDGKSFIIYPE